MAFATARKQDLGGNLNNQNHLDTVPQVTVKTQKVQKLHDWNLDKPL